MTVMSEIQSERWMVHKMSVLKEGMKLDRLANLREEGRELYTNTCSLSLYARFVTPEVIIAIVRVPASKLPSDTPWPLQASI